MNGAEKAVLPPPLSHPAPDLLWDRDSFMNPLVNYPTAKTRIMIVDDQSAATHLWKLMLEKTGGYVVQEENAGARALETAREFKPDLLLLDVNMPVMDGGEIAIGFRGDKVLKDLPIVFLTSLISREEAALGRRIEGCPCLAKPASLDDLLQSIQENLD